MRSDRISLYEFMPYGAPELLEVARRNMAGAVVAGIGFWIAVAALAIAAGMILSRNAREITVPVPPIIDLIRDLTPPPPVYVPPAPKTAPTPPEVVGPNAPATPVPDAAAPNQPVIGESQPTVPPIPGRSGDVQPVAPTLPPEVIPGPYEPQYYDKEPVAFREVKPVYPPFAQEAGIDGLVIVRVMVGKDGRVMEAFVLPKHSIPMLDAAAVEAARQWRFDPAMVNGHPIAVWVTIPMRFRLN